jgi:hypothetical protein
MKLGTSTTKTVLALLGLGLLVFMAAGTALMQGRAGLEGARAAPDADLSVLYTFSGVTDDGEQGSASRREATSIHCTNLDAGDVQVEVQIYQWNGTDVYTGTVTMPPNRSFTFSTQNTTIYFDDVILGGSPGTDAIFQGSGRVLSASPRVICTAQALDPLNYPPVFMDKLALYYGDGYPVGQPRMVYVPVIVRDT